MWTTNCYCPICCNPTLSQCAGVESTCVALDWLVAWLDSLRSDGAKESCACSLLMKSCSNYSLLIRSCSKWNSYSPWLNLSVSILRNIHAISLISSHKHAHTLIYCMEDWLYIHYVEISAADELLLLCQHWTGKTIPSKSIYRCGASKFFLWSRIE